MKHPLRILTFCLFPLWAQAQSHVDSLVRVFKNTLPDSLRYSVAIHLSGDYRARIWNYDSAFYYADKAVAIALKNHQELSEAGALIEKGRCLVELGDFASALLCYQRTFEITTDPASEKRQEWGISKEETNSESRIEFLAYVHQMYGVLMLRTGNVKQQIFHYLESARLAKHGNDANLAVSSYVGAGRAFLKLNKLDSAIFCLNEAEKIPPSGSPKFFIRSKAILRGDIYLKQGKDQQAIQNYFIGLKATLMDLDWRSSPSNFYFRLRDYHLSKGHRDSAIYYARKNLEAILAEEKTYRHENNLGDAYESMFQEFEMNHQQDSTFKYQRLALITKDSLYKLQIKTLSSFQQANLGEQLRLKNIEKEKQIFQNEIRTYALLVGLASMVLVVALLYRNNRLKQKSNSQLAIQKEKVEHALNELKAAQSQLIQAEKMASLGELTAGIAHEIQNPLNFVNNFSELNNELLSELKNEIEKGNVEEVKVIANAAIENQQKINHHGKRADSIVKGMLQHSRSSSGQKELTDINELSDEYLRLSYHGLRAKDKTFSAKFETDFDELLPQISVVPQDIGRVILNLINNAFYAVSEKKKQNGNAYEPTVKVTTRKIGNHAELKVMDNGNGIPQNIVDKIFQPFFTTKPPGEGTGLGLSLSYDIITKGHNGQIKVVAEENEGTEIIITLPIK